MKIKYNQYVYSIFMKTNWTNVFHVLPILLAGVLLIIVMVAQINSPSATIPHIGISTVYVEYLLSFIASFVVIYWMLAPFVYDLMRGRSATTTTVNLRGYLFLSFYAVMAIVLSPFGLLSIRFFIEDENYAKYISMSTIVSTLVVLYFTFRAAFP
jgi:hypothetical protein